MLRFFIKKNIRPLPCSSSFAKRHVHVGYSVLNTLITPLAHYHLFVSAPSAQLASMPAILAYFSDVGLVLSDLVNSLIMGIIVIFVHESHVTASQKTCRIFMPKYGFALLPTLHQDVHSTEYLYFSVFSVLKATLVLFCYLDTMIGSITAWFKFRYCFGDMPNSFLKHS